MRTEDEVRSLLAQKFAVEKKRLKSYGTKYNSMDLANACAPWVIALMAESRTRELRRLEVWIEKRTGEKTGLRPSLDKLLKQIAIRKRETKIQAQAIRNMAQTREEKRPWKPS